MSKVYVGTYAKYAAGNIAGKWLDLEDFTDAEEFNEACKALHADEADPEFMFQDWEDIPEGMISESHIDPEVFDWVQMDEDDKELLSVYRSEVDQAGTLEQAQEANNGRYSSAEDFAVSLFDELGELSKVPDFLRCHIDWAGVARDLSADYVFADYNGDVWVFRRM